VLLRRREQVELPGHIIEHIDRMRPPELPQIPPQATSQHRMFYVGTSTRCELRRFVPYPRLFTAWHGRSSLRIDDDRAQASSMCQPIIRVGLPTEVSGR
jgi:hypothetical protein